MKGSSLYISLSNGWFSIKCHLLIKIFLRLGNDGLYCVTKGINPLCTLFGFCWRADPQFRKEEETGTNISSLKLTSEQLGVLKHGLTHSICPPYIIKCDEYTSFELIHRSVFRNIIDKGRTDIINFWQLSHTYIASHRRSQNDRKEWGSLKSLRRNRNIVILNPDKEYGVVVLDRATYDESGILKLITGSSKFYDKNLRQNVSKWHWKI